MSRFDRSRFAAVVGLEWPTLLVLGACAGIAVGGMVAPPAEIVAAVVVACVVGGLRAAGGARILAVGLALAAAGVWWGALRADALGSSTLASHLRETRRAVVVVTGPARRSPFSVRVPAEIRSYGSQQIRERVLLRLPAGRAPPPGAVLELLVRPEAPHGPETGFDERAWLARKGVHVVLHGSHWRVVGRRGGIGGVADRVREQLTHGIDRGTRGQRRALTLGIVLGEDDGLDDELTADFRASGLAHLLAVSGQNITFVVVGTVGVLFVLGVSTVFGHAVAIVTVAAYVAAVGWEPSVVRAGVAGVLVSLAWISARERQHWHFMAIGALVLLAWHPRAWQEPGFQLSFAAVAAIFALYGRLVRLAEGYPVPRRVAEVGALTISATIATAPIAYAHFGALPVWTVPANIVAEPAVPFLLWFALAAGVVEPVLPSAAVALGWLAGLCAAWIAWTARVFASLPYAQVESGRAVAVVAAAVVVPFLIARCPRPGRVALACLVSVPLLVVGARAVDTAPGWTPPTGVRVTVLDVGQGDAILLEVAEGAVLVDQGPPEADVADQLRRHGLRSLTALVFTHPQLDHVGGAPDVIRRLDVGTVIEPGLAATSPETARTLREARARGASVIVARAGQQYRIGRLALRVLWPDASGSATDDPNDHAIVILARYGQFEVLLTADAESNVTRRLPLRQVDVLKVAHHGSEDPGLPDLLRTTRPSVAAISVGRGNDYDHPHGETLAALEAHPGLRILRTDVDGEITIESDGTSYTVRTAG